MSDEIVKDKPTYIGHRGRLRERFLAAPEALPDYELLEIILFPAKPVGDVKPLAKALMAKFGTFAGVCNASVQDLGEVEGVSDAAIAAIQSVRVAAERLLKAPAKERTVIQSWTALLDYCRLHLGHKKHEEFHVLFLNQKLALIADEMQQKGTVDHTPVYPREIMKRALELSASSLILMHNHPTGDVTPSKADIDITKQIIAAATPLNIKVHDHLIIGANGHFSFKANGLL